MFRGVRVFGVLAVLLFFVRAAHPQALPYISDIVGEEDIQAAIAVWESEDGAPRLIGSFKIFNPDTVPFYLWVSFENGGKFKHRRYGAEYPAVRLLDMELRYRDRLERPLVKEFPSRRSASRAANWMGARPGARGAREAKREAKRDAGMNRAAEETGEPSRAGAAEIAFWKEDAQGYYEMELWGILYAPDVKEAVYPGEYMENIRFEIEPMPAQATRLKRQREMRKRR
jgi:hypothetical protein